MSRPPAFACEAARHRVLAANSLRLHCLEWGSPERPGLLLLHGGAAHVHWFDTVATAFQERFHVVALDQRGHGESQWPDPPSYRTEDFARDVVGVMDALGWSQMALLGHSMGGHNAMCFAAWHPARVSRLVIVDSRPAIPEEELLAMLQRGPRPLRRHESLDAAVGRFRLIPPESTADPQLLAHLARAGISERDGTWAYRFDPACDGTRRPADAWPLLAKIECPTLIIRGEKSTILSRRTAEAMAKGIAHARVDEIPGAYHHVPLDAPASLVVLVERFL